MNFIWFIANIKLDRKFGRGRIQPPFRWATKVAPTHQSSKQIRISNDRNSKQVWDIRNSFFEIVSYFALPAAGILQELSPYPSPARGEGDLLKHNSRIPFPSMGKGEGGGEGLAVPLFKEWRLLRDSSQCLGCNEFNARPNPIQMKHSLLDLPC
jgi:hypothetical protein